MSEKCINIVCSAMLQSWRNTSIKGNLRYTCDHPTKSGINGMIACAMGIQRGDPSIENMLHKFKLYLNHKKSGPMCPLENNGINKMILPDMEYLMDFHTVGGRGENEPVQMMNAVSTYLSVPSITRREYIVNHSFFMHVVAEEELLKKMEEYLQNPVWDYYLGSKCCIPAERVFRGISELESEGEERDLEYIRY